MNDIPVQPIEELSERAASALNLTDTLLGMNSSEGGYRMLIQDLGDYIIQNATSSLAGSDQTLAAVISTLGSAVIPVAIGDNADLNNYTSQGFYYCSSNSYARNAQNCPATVAFTLLVMKKGAYATQILAAPPNVYVRTQVSSGWNEWFTIDPLAHNSWILDKSPNSVLTSGQDLDSFMTPGVYDCDSSSVASSLLHRPTDVTTGFRLIVTQSGYGTSSYAVQIILMGSGSVGTPREYRRAYTGGSPPNGTWSDWAKTPTRAEMDSVASKNIGGAIIEKVSVNGGSSYTRTFTGAERGIIFMASASVDARGILGYSSTSSLTVSTSWLIEATDLSVSTSAGAITITNNTSTALSVLIFR